MMPSDKIKELLLATCLYASLSAQPAWALTIHGTPTANPQATLGDHKKTPNMSVTLTQALALLKAQTFETSPRLPAWERNLDKRMVKAPKANPTV